MIRVLIAKPGLDPHDRGAKILGIALRNIGMEVIYTGLHQTPENIVRSAVQEDVDIICLSILSGAHLPLTGRIMELLKQNSAADITQRKTLCADTVMIFRLGNLRQVSIIKDQTSPKTDAGKKDGNQTKPEIISIEKEQRSA